MFYLLWVPLLMLMHSLLGYASVQANNNSKSWFYISWLLICIPVWPMVAKYSKNIVFDGLLFDSIMLITYSFAVIIICKQYETLKFINFIGFFLVISGLILFRR
jgi:hypothetical protein